MGEESSQNLIAPVRVQSGEDYLLNLAHADLHDEYIAKQLHAPCSKTSTFSMIVMLLCNNLHKNISHIPSSSKGQDIRSMYLYMIHTFKLGMS